VGAFYGPRIWVNNVNSDSGGKLLVDPVGHIAGLAAQCDAKYQGPHKSPAGVNFPLATALDVERQSNGAELYDDSTSNTLADSFVNTIRIKNGKVVVWGLRTLATDARWRQVPAARVYCLIIVQGLLLAEPYTFEPIDSDGKLFARVQNDFGGFLESLRSHGALFGDKPGSQPKPTDAYAVVCDRGNNTPLTLSANELHIDVAAALAFAVLSWCAASSCARYGAP
jgi:phage tail sheath protein FI